MGTGTRRLGMARCLGLGISGLGLGLGVSRLGLGLGRCLGVGKSGLGLGMVRCPGCRSLKHVLPGNRIPDGGVGRAIDGSNSGFATATAGYF